MHRWVHECERLGNEPTISPVALSIRTVTYMLATRVTVVQIPVGHQLLR